MTASQHPPRPFGPCALPGRLWNPGRCSQSLAACQQPPARTLRPRAVVLALLDLDPTDTERPRPAPPCSQSCPPPTRGPSAAWLRPCDPFPRVSHGWLGWPTTSSAGCRSAWRTRTGQTWTTRKIKLRRTRSGAASHSCWAGSAGNRKIPRTRRRSIRSCSTKHHRAGQRGDEHDDRGRSGGCVDGARRSRCGPPVSTSCVRWSSGRPAMHPLGGSPFITQTMTRLDLGSV
jgi:hypothetical protein